jgi:hypothetical protein
MNYEAHYGRLIERARTRDLEGYSEKHHILPRCLKGTNAASNIVRLTPEEHYVAHQLLVKMHRNHQGLVYAAIRMTIGPDKRSNNKLYGWIRRLQSKLPGPNLGKKMSAETRAKVLILNRSPERRAKVAEANRNRIFTPEIRANMATGHRGKPKSPEHIAKVAAAHTGMTRSLETRAKMSAIQSTRPRSPHTEETRAKISSSLRARRDKIN